MTAAILKRLLAASLLALAVFARADEPVRVVATGGRTAFTFYTPPAGCGSFWQRTVHRLGGPVSEIQVGYMGWINSGKDEIACANEIVIENAWIERESTGQVLPLTFGGWRRLVIPANFTTPCWLSDPIPTAAWTGTVPGRDEIFWVHAKGTMTEGGRIPYGTPVTRQGCRFIVYPAERDSGTMDFAGPVPTIPGATMRNAGLPMVFLGRFSEPGHLAVIGIGDSILDGFGDTQNPTPVISGFGFFNRAAIDENGRGAIAMLNLTRSGQTAQSWITHNKYQSALLPYANVVVEEFGTNDIGSNGAKSDAGAIHSRLESIWLMARNAGVQKIVRTRLLPRTTSEKRDWTSLQAQTPNPGWGDGEARDQLNDALLASLQSGKIDALVDTLSPVADPSDDHYWRPPPEDEKLTSDGTHPRAAGHARLAVPLRETLLHLKVN